MTDPIPSFLLAAVYNAGPFDKKSDLTFNKEEFIAGLWEVQGTVQPGNGLDIKDLIYLENFLQIEMGIQESEISIEKSD